MNDHAASREAEQQSEERDTTQQQLALLQQQLVQLNLGLHQTDHPVNDDEEDNASEVLSIAHADDKTKVLHPAGAAKLEENMQHVKVTDMGGRDAVDMELSDTTTITEVKQEVQKATGIPTNGQTLFEAATGEELSDEQKLRDVAMSEGMGGGVLVCDILGVYWHFSYARGSAAC